jgi:hypothetical protein
VTESEPHEASPCPPWCERLQCQEPRPEDRFHQLARTVPVTLRRRHPTGSGVDTRPEPAVLNVVVFTRATAPDETWVSLDVGDWSSTIAVTLESMRRVHAVLGKVLSAAEA